jgi:hypothetical protein
MIAAPTLNTQETLAEVNQMLAEAKRIDRLNRPTSKRNLAIKAENKAKALRGEPPCSYLPLPHKLDYASANWFEAEREHAANLRKKSPEQWLADVESIPEQFRAATASAVWWDYFSERTIAKRWNHLDKFLNPRVPDITPEELAQSLFRVGYSGPHAVRRAFQLNQGRK